MWQVIDIKAGSKVVKTMSAVLACVGLTTLADTLIWDGNPLLAGVQGGGGTWSTSHANWTKDDGLTHSAWDNGAGDTAKFGPPNTVGTIVLGSDIVVHQLHMLHVYSNGHVFNGDYTLTIGTGGYITSRSQTFNVDIDLAGNQSWTLNGGPTIVTGDIGETVPSKLSASATAGLYLYGNNTFSGGFDLPQTKVGVGSDTALGSGRIWMSANTTIKQIEALGGPRTLANPLETAWAGGVVPFTLAGVHDLTFTGDFNLVGSSAATLDLIVTNTAVTTFSGQLISGDQARNVTKSGAGMLVLSGDNTYTGLTSITGGTLLVEGNTSNQGNYTVASGATLGGTGSIGLRAGMQMTLGGTLSPGSLGDSTGMLAVNGGNVVCEAGSAVEIQIGGPTAGTDHDQLLGNRTLVINGGTLVVNWVDGFSPPVDEPTSFQIFAFATGIAGTFAAYDLPPLPAAYMQWDTSALYTLGVITAAIPEPGTIVLGFAGLLAGLQRRRRRASRPDANSL